MLQVTAPLDISLNKSASFAVPYLLESKGFFILAVKGTESFPREFGIGYQWLLVNKFSQKITSLTVSYVDSSSEVEERFFEEGYLKFNHNNGTFIEKYNSAQHNLQHVHLVEIPNSIYQAVAEFLKA